MSFEKLLKSLNLSFNITRSYGKHNKKYLYKDGKKYENIIYYPRTADQQDPPVIPSKLFRVQRIKPVKGNPFWEKRILKDLGLDGKQNEFTVVKNIPENNARLWKIKHLVKITPLSFPYGEPSAKDINYTILKDNGECIVTKDIGPVESRCSARADYDQESKRLDTDLLKKDARLKWLNPY